MLNQTSIVVFYAENNGGVHFDQKFVSGSVGASKVVLKEKYNKNPPNSINNLDNPNRNPPNSINNKYFRGFRALWTLEYTF